jgi:hypothetical protein
MLNVVDTLEAVFSRNYRVFIDVSSFLYCITTVIPLWLTGVNRGGFLLFGVEVTSNQLWHSYYSPYQSSLHTKIKQLKKEGLGYRKIAKILNKENIKTPRGKTFYPSSVYSILKKKKIRNDRLNEHFKKKISKLRFEYFDS